MTRRQASSFQRDDTGATLVLALAFLLCIGLVVGALASWSANDVGNIGKLKLARSTLSAAEGATQTQMNAMRYAYATTCPGSPYSLDGVSIVVTCTSTVNPASSASRVISFSASMAGGNSGVLVAAQVSYDDFSGSFNKNDCLVTTPSPTTCGSGMTLNSWVVNPGGG